MTVVETHFKKKAANRVLYYMQEDVHRSSIPILSLKEITDSDKVTKDTARQHWTWERGKD